MPAGNSGFGFPRTLGEPRLATGFTSCVDEVTNVSSGGGPMALSDDEEQLLDQMEAALSAEDPKLSHALSGKGTRRVHRRRAALAGVGFLAGLGLLIAGMSTTVFFSVLGFVVMLAAAITAIYSWQHVNDAPTDSSGAERPRTPQSTPNSQGLMDKMEERWRKRRDESGF